MDEKNSLNCIYFFQDKGIAEAREHISLTEEKSLGNSLWYIPMDYISFLNVVRGILILTSSRMLASNHINTI